MCQNIKYRAKYVELCFELYYKNVVRILAILYTNFCLHRVNGSISLRKYKTININKYTVTFYCAHARPKFIWSYHNFLLSETRGEARCRCNLIRRIDRLCPRETSYVRFSGDPPPPTPLETSHIIIDSYHKEIFKEHFLLFDRSSRQLNSNYFREFYPSRTRSVGSRSTVV